MTYNKKYFLKRETIIIQITIMNLLLLDRLRPLDMLKGTFKYISFIYLLLN